MATQTLTRTIQWYGKLEITPEMQTSKFAQISFDIIRPQPQTYDNGNFFPQNETFYGYAQMISQGRVLDSIPLRHDNQLLLDWTNSTAYLQQTISCQLEAILTTFENLGRALNLAELQRINPIKNWENPQLGIDFVEIKLLYQTMVAQITIVWDVIEACSVPESDPSKFKKPQLPQPPPIKKPSNSPDSDLPPISPPYNQPNDDGLTYKPGGNGGDGQTGTPGDRYSLFFDVFDGTTLLTTYQVNVFAPFSKSATPTDITNGTFKILVQCSGLDTGGSSTPQPYGGYKAGFFVGNNPIVVFKSSVPPT